MDMTEDEKYMQRCIQLARNGMYGAPPNPMVGAVVVCHGKIIGEGYHRRCGEAHAEVNAIRSVRDESMLKESTIYVSLEPCSHFGKTPPCADLIIEKGIPRVVIGCADPFAKVAGRGIRKLRDAGAEVTVGVLEKECLALNRRFMTFHTLRRPYITLKWAESADGFIDRLRADATSAPCIFSSDYTRMLVHRERAVHQAILVGTETARKDDPSLQVRDWPGRSPLRLVLDRTGRLRSGLKLFDGTVPTRVYVDVAAGSPEYEGRTGVTCVRVDYGHEVLRQVLDDLYTLSVQSLLVEGGSRLLSAFMDAGLWDEIRVEQAGFTLGEGVSAPPRPCGEMDVEMVDGRRIVRVVHPAGCVVKSLV